MRELPMMEQVEDFSLEIVLAMIFHFITKLIRRAEVVQRVVFACRVTLPAAWHCPSSQSGRLQEIAGR